MTTPNTNPAEGEGLKPCPCCGGTAELTSRFDVKCTACGLEINSSVPELEWSRRATEDRLRAERDKAWNDVRLANAQAEKFEREWYLRGDELDAARAEVERVRGEWVSVEDRLPEDGQDVMAYMPEDDRFTVAWLENGKWEREFMGVDSGAVTHWRPLPPAPQPEQKGEG